MTREEYIYILQTFYDEKNAWSSIKTSWEIKYFALYEVNDGEFRFYHAYLYDSENSFEHFKKALAEEFVTFDELEVYRTPLMKAIYD